MMFAFLCRSLFCVGLVGIFSANAMAQQASDLTFFTVQGSNAVNASSVVLTKAYRKLGKTFSTKHLPAERSLKYSNLGKSDGELHRIAGIELKYPNLIPIPVAINKIEAVALSHNKNILIDGWSSLKSYKVGIIRGIKFSENGTKGMQPYVVNTNQQLFDVLDKGKVDLILLPRSTAIVLNNNRANKATILRPAVAEYKLFHYLHQKNYNLIAPLQKVLQAMTDSGQIENLRKQYLISIGGS